MYNLEDVIEEEYPLQGDTCGEEGRCQSAQVRTSKSNFKYMYISVLTEEASHTFPTSGISIPSSPCKLKSNIVSNDPATKDTSLQPPW